MTAELTFLDTNVLVYAHDRSAGTKHTMARALVVHLWDTRMGTLSPQVLSELYVTLTRKLPKPMPTRRAHHVISRYATWPVQRLEAGDVIAASELAERHRLSFWDALILRSAIRSGAAVLVTEDMPGSRIPGIRIENPFG
jgi:predicted nucleic acid-binding protein